MPRRRPGKGAEELGETSESRFFSYFAASGFAASGTRWLAALTDALT